MRFFFWLFIFAFLPSVLFSDKLETKTVQKVLDYYLSEEDSVIVYQIRSCEEFSYASNAEEQCLGANPASFSNKEEFVVQIFLFAPYGDSYTIMVEEETPSQSKNTNTYQVEGSFQAVLPIKIFPNEIGELSLKIYQKKSDSQLLIGEKRFQIL